MPFTACGFGAGRQRGCARSCTVPYADRRTGLGRFPYDRYVAIRIRYATENDVEEVLGLWREADAEPTHTDDRASIRRLIAHDPAALIIAADTGGRVFGSVIAGWDGWRGSIYRLVVAPSHRRKGLGRQLLAVAEERLRSKEAVRLQAIVVETDVQACGFWRASGWVQQEERLRFVRG